MTEDKSDSSHPGLLFAGIFLVVITVGVGFASGIVGYVSHFEHRADVGCMEADVVSYQSGSDPYNAAQYAYFVVRLPSGKRVRIEDVGTRSEKFRGVALISEQRGTATGTKTYTFATKAECKPHQRQKNRP